MRRWALQSLRSFGRSVHGVLGPVEEQGDSGSREQDGEDGLGRDAQGASDERPGELAPVALLDAPEHLPGVLENFERLAAIAAHINAFKLGPADEPAPVWRP